jgi:hypothetical protein
MATKIVPSLRASLERLKHGGAVNGLCLGWRRQVLVNLLPYEDHRADRLIHDLHAAHQHFADGGRDVQSFWFGYEGVHALALFSADCTLVILHSRTADVDFLAQVGLAFLQDSQLLVDAVLNPSETAGSETDTQELTQESYGEPPPTTHLIGRELI